MNEMIFEFKCNWHHRYCTAPNTNCPHWQGIFCELDEAIENEIYCEKKWIKSNKID